MDLKYHLDLNIICQSLLIIRLVPQIENPPYKSTTKQLNNLASNHSNQQETLMSQSQFSFQSSTHGALQQAMGLLQQKDLIIQKYMQKLGSQEGKIEELVHQIQRLNWENREKQYHEEFIRRIPIKHLLQEGFAEEIYLKQNQQLLNGTNKKTSQTKQKTSTISSTNKLYLVKIVVSSDAQQIQLTDKMQLFKDNLKEITYQKNDMKRQKKQTDQIESYCQSVLRQVESLRAKMEAERQEREVEVNKVKGQNVELRQNIVKLEDVIKESKQSYLTQLSGKQKQIQLTKKNHQAHIQSLQSFLTGQIKQLVLQVGNLKQQINECPKKRCQNKLSDKVIDEKIIEVKIIEENQVIQLTQQQRMQKQQKQQQQKKQQQKQKQQKQQQQRQQQINSYKQEISQLKIQITNLQSTLQKQQTQHQTIVNSLNNQLQSLKQQITKCNQQKQTYKGTSSLQLQVSTKQSQQHQQQLTQLKQQLQQLTAKYTSQLTKALQQSTLIQTLQLKLTQMTTKFYQAQQQPNQTVHTAKFRNEMSSQTDPQLVFDINFLRKTKQTIVQTHRQHMHHHQQQLKQQNNSSSNEAESFEYKISLPPSLDILNFDFDNSMSQQPHNVSNAEMRKQVASNLSSGSFGRSDRHMEEMKVTHLNKNAKKYLSEQVIPFDNSVGDNNSNVKGKGQLPGTKDDLGSQLKQIKLKTKVASYSQRNIIVEQPYQDQDHNEFRINYVNIIQQMSPFNGREIEHNDDLIPSISDITESSASCQGNLDNPLQEFVDAIRDEGLGDSDHPSETYKNSLRLPYGYSSGGHLDKNQHKHHDRHQLSKSIGYNIHSPRGLQQTTLANKATQLLQLKSPQYIMKTLIQKTFPLQTNPFKLSNQYFNVAQLMKQEGKNKMDYLNIQKNKSSNPGSDSVINILIESHQRSKENHDQVEVQMLDQYLNQVKLEQMSNPGTTKEKESEEKMLTQQKQKLQTPNADFRTPRKKETIELAQSLDFDSLKKLQKESGQNTKSRKKPKIIYFRR